MFLGLGTWIFIRHVGNMSQVSHMYLLQSFVTFVLLTKFLESIKTEIKLITSLIAIVLVIRSGTIFIGNSTIESKSRMLASVQLRELQGIESSKMSDLSLAKQQVFHSLRGKRMKYYPGGDYRESQVFIFSRY